MNNPGYNDPSNPPPPHLRPEGPVIAGRIDPTPPPPPDSAPPAALTAGPDFGGLLRGLRRRWMTAVAVGVPLALLAAAAAWYLLAPRYTAQAQVRVLLDDPAVLFNKKDPSQSVFTTLVKTTAAQIKSRPVINDALKQDAVRRLNLENKYPDVAAWLDDELKVETQDGSELITITLSSSDADEAVTVLRAIVNTFKDRNLYLDKEERKKRVTDLQSAYSTKVQEWVKKKAALTKATNPEGSQPLAVVMQDLYEGRRQSGALRLRLAEALANLDALPEETKLPPSGVTDAMVKAEEEKDPAAVKVKQSIEYYQREAQRYRDSGDTRSPTYLARLGILADLMKQQTTRRKELRAEKEQQLKNGPANPNQPQLTRKVLDKTIGNLKDQIAEVDKDVQRLTDLAAKMSRPNAENDAQEADLKNQELVIAGLRVQIDQMLVELSAPDRTFTYQDAELQKKDIKKQLLGAIVAPIGVFAMVCFLLALGEHRQRRIHHAGQVARGLGIRVVGTVPHLPGLEHHLVGPTGEPELEGHPALESIDALRTVLLREAGSDGGRVVLVTSAVAGEGKTTLASHLAGSLARAGRKTLLIDGDLRAPAVHQLFEVPMQPGFSEVLLAEVEAADAVQPTTIDGLSVMAAGQWDRTVLHALARDGIEGVLEKLRQEFDFLVVDSHPVLAATDSLLLAQRVDAVILSVLRTVSQMPQVYAASQRLTGLGVRVLGAVVNASDPNEVYASGPAAVPAAA
jgi:capsular exopolysaccharide synthesis family protein